MWMIVIQSFADMIPWVAGPVCADAMWAARLSTDHATRTLADFTAKHRL